MTFDRDFLTSPTGQVLLVAAVLALGLVVVRSQRAARPAPGLPAVRPAPSVPLPKVLTREVARFVQPPPPPSAPVVQVPEAAPVVAIDPGTPLEVYCAPPAAPTMPVAPSAPYGRLIPCETVFALESSRLETPVIGLVTEDVWHDGRLVIPAGAEVHGRAMLDSTRERIAAQPGWRIVWRTPGADNGLELAVEGIALDREFDGPDGTWGANDGSAGLRGQVIRGTDNRELRLFAASFLASATGALQDVQPAAGLLGPASIPAATARNAVLAGTGAVLREHAQALREAIDRDGFYVRVPAGKPFYLYLTQTLDRRQARRSEAAASAPHSP